MYCLDCDYVLDGTAKNRCPECGRTFDPGDPLSFRRTLASPFDKILRWLIAQRFVAPFSFIALLWATYFVPGISILALTVLGIGVVVQLERKRWYAALLTVCLSPFVWSGVKGVVDYGLDRGAIRYMGLAHVEFHNIDRKYRCHRVMSGSLGWDGDWFLKHGPYNAGLKMMLIAFGPMNDSYVGPYPTKVDVRAGLRGAVPISVTELQENRLTINGTTVTLTPGFGEYVLNDTRFWWRNYSLLRGLEVPEVRRIEAAFWKNDLVLLRVHAPSSICEGRDPATPPAFVALISRKAGHAFAYYAQGGYNHSLPDARWKSSMSICGTAELMSWWSPF